MIATLTCKLCKAKNKIFAWIVLKESENSKIFYRCKSCNTLNAFDVDVKVLNVEKAWKEELKP